MIPYLNLLRKNLINIPGWHTKRKIVVIESDDWGSIRMPSKQVYEKCLKAGYQVDKNIFSKYDSLESEDDLVFLFEILSSFHDNNGNHPIITANSLTCNPDFEKIKESRFESYSYELITETFKKYPKHANCWNLWKEGLQTGLFYPQFHGREHLNVSRFMNDLRINNQDAHFAFEHHMPGIFPIANVAIGNFYVVALEHFDKNDLIEKGNIVNEGLTLFNNLFHYYSQSFIATNYSWSDTLNVILARAGVKYLQGSIAQLIPKGSFTGFRKKYHFMGQTNRCNQTYMVRNAYFEPTLTRNDTVESCLKQIETAFYWQKPAIISSHRINFAGYIDPKNRDRSLILFKELLEKILKLWPDVEFMTSVQLGHLIETSRKIKS